MMRLRPATVADSEFVFQTRKTVLRDYVDATWGWDEANERERHGLAFDVDATRIIVADEADAGLLVVHHEAARDYLQRLFLAPAFQGRGIGAEVVERVVAEAGGRRIELRCLLSNPRALAFWQRMGFEVVHVSETHYEMARSGA